MRQIFLNPEVASQSENQLIIADLENVRKRFFLLHIQML